MKLMLTLLLALSLTWAPSAEAHRRDCHHHERRPTKRIKRRPVKRRVLTCTFVPKPKCEWQWREVRR